MSWIVFVRDDNGRIGLFPTSSVGHMAKGTIIETFYGNFDEAMARADELEGQQVHPRTGQISLFDCTGDENFLLYV